MNSPKRIQSKRRESSDTLSRWMLLSMALGAFQLLAGFLYLVMVVLASGSNPLAALFFPITPWEHQAYASFVPATLGAFHVFLVLACFFVPPLWALQLTLGRKRYPFRQALGIHLLINVFLYACYRSFGWEA